MNKIFVLLISFLLTGCDEDFFFYDDEVDMQVVLLNQDGERQRIFSQGELIIFKVTIHNNSTRKLRLDYQSPLVDIDVKKQDKIIWRWGDQQLISDRESYHINAEGYVDLYFEWDTTKTWSYDYVDAGNYRALVYMSYTINGEYYYTSDSAEFTVVE